jgi:Protein of unknown function (DUF3237)
MNMHETETIAGPGLTHLFTMRAALGARLDGGDGPVGRRVFNAASGGEFAGARLRGAVVPGSADWMLIRKDGSMVIDARAILQTDDGATIHMTYAGRAIFPADLLADVRDPARRHLIDPARYFIRTTPSFETGAEGYGWLNDIVCVATGRLTERGLNYEVFQVG